MPADLRRARILERIQRDGGASVRDLARDYGVSAITVHRDLERLAARRPDRACPRRRAAARQPLGRLSVATDWAKRLQQALPEKQAIAARAASFIEDGSTIFVDSSTTCLLLARHLERHPPRALTLVTNSPAIALELQAQSIHVIVTPGEVDQTLRHDRRALDGRVPRRAEHRDGLLLGRRRHARARADDDAALAGRHAPRRRGVLEADGRSHRLVEVRPVRPALDRPASSSSTP